MPSPPDHPAPEPAAPKRSARLTLEAALAALQSPLSAGAASGSPAGTAARRGLGLRAGLWLITAICLVPVVAGTVAYLQLLRDQAVRDAYALADLVALGTSQSLQWLLQDTQATMAAIAARPQVRALDPAGCDPIFRQFHDISWAHKALSLRRLDGSSVCSELASPPSAASVAVAPWFRAAVQAGGFHASAAHVGNVTGQWTARLTHPVAGASGRTEGLLVAPIDLSELQRRLYARLPASVVSAVVDGSNHVLLRAQRHDERVGKPAAPTIAAMITRLRAHPQRGAHRFAEIGIDGVRNFYALRGVPGSDWVVVAALPEAATLQAYHQARNRALALFAGILVLVAGAAWAVGRGIAGPMGGLARAARGLAAGDNSQRAPETGPREVAEVAREFNRMAVAVAASEQQLRAGERQYRTLIENLPVAVVTHHPDGRIEVFNHRACELLRLPPERMNDRGLRDSQWHFVAADGRRLAPDEYPAARVLASRLPLLPESLGIVDDVVAAASPDGAAAPPPHTWVVVTGYPQFDAEGRLQRAIIAFVDVTLQHQTEELRQARDAAEAASRAKSVFLSRVSHELRTPLNAINGFSELMLLDPALSPQTQDRVRHVLRAGQHLLSLINQILDLTRVESGQVHSALRPLALRPLLQDCLDVCAPLAQARGIEMRLEVMTEGAPGAPGAFGAAAPWVQADDTQLRQVLINLLSNAIKYNRPQGQVRVVVAREDPGDGGPDTVVRVHDTGAGLTPVQRAALFQPFHRGGAEFSGIEGHGLGLVISRLLVQAMSGRLEVESEPGQGSCFTLWLHGVPPPA